MSQTCTRCDVTGFLNVDQVPEDVLEKAESSGYFHEDILEWINANEGHDVQACDCCGNGEDWYGEPGWHYGADDPVGDYGPYAYNGGLCECH